ncbi:hypothetical protein L915_01275 [Phytophthora nicotianae]|uniref:Uncharacterized protein n=2 Tax=Phytophthora nicotianae TaxID=4792 RepID=W2HKM2_PHYNI|nr:hypothetical protein L915_01275 [Phytophthora nicotianae]
MAVRGKTVTLLVYEYGAAITKASDLEAFKTTCVLRSETDRAGTTAEVCFQQIVDRLLQHWDSSFQATTVVWRM